MYLVQVQDTLEEVQRGRDEYAAKAHGMVKCLILFLD